jgi:ElaB/YqjD/DUF883 family membrane-anchored ribosome-binding protein
MTQDYTSPSSGPASSGAGSSGSSDGGSAGRSGGDDRKFDRAVHATHEAVDRAAASLDEAAERMRQSYEHMCAMEREWAESCRIRVREHPLACVAAAVAAGVLIGRLSSRH